MFLRKIIENKKLEVAQKREKLYIKQLLPLSRKETRDFKGALKKEPISVIGEIKKASPSKGIIADDFDPEKIAKVYENSRIDAISVLTEEKFFLGNDRYIKMVKRVCSKPILRKDFIVDQYQIYETLALGADAILLIAAVLGKRIKEFYEISKEIGLYPLVEVHDRNEVEIALKAGCDIIGINNRNLKTFEVNLRTTEELIKDIPKDIIVVSESGIRTPDDINYLRSLGVDAVLIGETFMRDLKGIGEFVARAK